MFFTRDFIKIIPQYAKFPVVAILGPRQSGKTTLSKHVFSKHQFVNLENPQLRAFAKDDPKGFLHEHENEHGIIIDEFQYIPELLSYIQVEVDLKHRPGYFVLTGSQNFLMNKAITQSLAGRVAIATLLPLSLHELKENNLAHDINDIIFNGCYPRIYHDQVAPTIAYPSYINTYVERDVHQLLNVGDILVFQKFMQLCAARTGQLLNISEIANAAGIDQRTAKNWLSVLAASYIIFFLQPYFNNFNKRLTKTPKLYFYDTGLACSLLRMQSAQDLILNLYRGHLFETLIISDLYKQYYNLGISPSLYFWRDTNGRVEVDCLVAQANKLFPIEIKSGETISQNFFTQLLEWNKITETAPENNTIIYGGTLNQPRSKGAITSWQDATEFVAKLYKES